MPQIFRQGKRVSDWLKGDLDNVTDYCREEGLVLAGADLVTGTVLGKITATGRYTDFDLAASDGSQTVAGILLLDVTSDSGNDMQRCAVIVRGPCVVLYDQLTWPVGISGGAKTTAEAALTALGILGREPA